MRQWIYLLLYGLRLMRVVSFGVGECMGKDTR